MGSVTLRPPFAPDSVARDRTFWLHDALSREPSDGTASDLDDRDVDVCIVGGGFTGLWTAIEIAERAPGSRVCVLEADVCGGGASGANAGYVMNLWPKLLSLQAIMPSDEALWLADEAARAVDDVAEVGRRVLDPADCRPAPWLWAATNDAQRAAWTDTLEALSAAGRSPLREVAAEEAGAMVGTDVHRGGVVDDTCFTVQPARLARALREAAIRAGVIVHEHTPVARLEAGRRTTVVTPRGHVRAERVILAINAWAAQLDDLGRRLVMVASDTFVTEPIPELLADLGWRDGVAVSDSRRRLNYYRTTADGRLVFGKGGVGVGYGAEGARTMWGDAMRMPELREQLVRTFPSLSGVRIARAWTAPVEYSVTSLPFCGWLRHVPGACYATGYSGDGVGPSRLIARVLASLALGQRDEYSECGLARLPEGRLPPEPLRFLGSRLVLPALRTVERSEDEGRTAPWPLRRLASIDPTGFVG